MAKDQLSKTRPLWRLSDFVVEEMPLMLASNDLGTIQEQVSVSLPSEVIVSAYDSNRELALLDLKLLEAALIHNGAEVPETLSAMVDFFCGTGLNIPVLQYHELVEVNPIDDMRTFTTGDAGVAEQLFYNTHRMIEGRLHRMIIYCGEFLQNQQQRNPIIMSSESVFDGGVLQKQMHDLRDMMKSHFYAFRKYLMNPHPIRKFDGPSGAFSWRVPYLELLFWGSLLPVSYLESIESKIDYYSREGATSLKSRLAYLDTAPTMFGYVEQYQGLPETVQRYMAYMKEFRKMHLGAVAKQLPAVFNDKAASTAGQFDAGTYLKNRIQHMGELYEFVEERLSKL